MMRFAEKVRAIGIASDLAELQDPAEAKRFFGKCAASKKPEVAGALSVRLNSEHLVCSQ